MICPNCKIKKLEKRIFANLSGGKLIACESVRCNVIYYFCQNCEKWFNEDFYECEEPGDYDILDYK